jgi:hypothetical protein
VPLLENPGKEEFVAENLFYVESLVKKGQAIKVSSRISPLGI